MTMYNYTFPAVRGIQNGRPFYQATVPFRVLASMLKLDDDFDARNRSQRIVCAPRAKKVAEYIQSNADGFYVVPPLVGVIDGDFTFQAPPGEDFQNVGNMVVPLDLKILLFDGQHRAYGIHHLMEKDKSQGHQSVAVMIFEDMTLAQRKQAFHDINHTQKTPSASLCIAYNSRSAFDMMVVDVFEASPLRGHIEYEKNAVSGDNGNLYALRALKDFAMQVTHGACDDEARELLSSVVGVLFNAINPVGEVADAGAAAYRSDSVVGHAVTLKALGMFARLMLVQFSSGWEGKVAHMRRASFFLRDADRWAGRCVSTDGKMISNVNAVNLTCIKLLQEAGCPLSPEMTAAEEVFTSCSQ